jgi:hypothetical protein
MKFKLAGSGVVSMVVLLVMSGCSPFIVSAEGEAPTPVIKEIPAEEPAGKLAADSLPCPQDVEGMEFVAEEAHGFCVLVPEGFEVNHPTDYEMTFVGPVPESGVQALGIIEVKDAEGKSAAEHAAPYIADSEALGLNVERQTITLSGEEAVVVDGLTGQDMNRRVFVVHEGKLYNMMFAPSDPSDANYDSLQSLYNAVIGSFAFLR